MPLGYLTTWRRWLLLASLLFTSQLAWATHIVGGELDLQHQTGSTYTLTLTLYFDAINGNAAALDQSIVAGVFDKVTNGQLQSVTLPLISNTFVSYTNPACAVGSLSTRKLLYVKDITLDAATYTSPSGYYVAVERCCRNLAISNIVNPGGRPKPSTWSFRPWCATAPRLSTRRRASSRPWAIMPA
ncbi:hypothetical protein GKZ68_16900 [Hymenobacter sp. BRD128]|uniref:hypothetical protein n=1 Tax=Hymenobacter sp. BRD128 TaxID=2675878 RepID=UPI0015660904|nr:hypothetical protein [Hymenobacter sp. BRD128]QKG58156.1 hypothetical protein GKZ68_16900 [Hymenobacter sp. BRD128]